jgi:hypothetical protein
MKKLLGVAILGVGLLAPTAVMNAQEHHDQMAHQWNDGEKDAWGRYLKAHHKKDHDWDHANKREKSDYWKWRDQHHDEEHHDH